MIGLSCRTDGLTRTNLRIAVLHRSLTGDNLHFARLVFHTPRNMVGRARGGLFSHPLTLSIDVELHLIGIVVVAPHINLLSGKPVPMRE